MVDASAPSTALVLSPEANLSLGQALERTSTLSVSVTDHDERLADLEAFFSALPPKNERAPVKGPFICSTIARQLAWSPASKPHNSRVLGSCDLALRCVAAVLVSRLFLCCRENGQGLT